MTIAEKVALAYINDPSVWPPRAWGVPYAGIACALSNRVNGKLGLIVNVSYRDRLTVFEVNVFDRPAMQRIFDGKGGPTGVPEHTYIDFEGMLDAGWRPD